MSDDVLVVGLGRFGSALAVTLSDMGYRVLAIDADQSLVQRHAHTLTHVVEGDATNEDVLRQLGAAEISIAAVCIGSDVEASVLATAALVEMGVPNVWAKAITAAHGKILSLVGAHHVVFPEADMGRRVAHLLAGRLLEYVTLDTDFVLAEMHGPGELRRREPRGQRAAPEAPHHRRVREAPRRTVHLRDCGHRARERRPDRDRRPSQRMSTTSSRRRNDLPRPGGSTPPH